MSEWISVRDKMPDEFRWVFVSADFLGDSRGWINIAMWDEGLWKFINGDGGEIDFGKVTHWMDLPDPPKLEESKGE